MWTIVKKRLLDSRVWLVAAIVAALGVGMVVGSSFAARAAAAAQTTQTFTGGVGVVVRYVNAGNTADYERVMRAFGESLVESSDGELNRMGSGYKLYRSPEPGPQNTVQYYSIYDPAVPGANYQEIAVLTEHFPPGPPNNGDEVRELYDAYVGSVAGGTAFNLDLVMEF
jgi:hypothetical protein